MGEKSFVDNAIMAFTKALSRLPAGLIRFRWLVLAFFIGFSGLSAYGVSGLVIDQGLDQWFDEDDKTLQVYQVFRRVFGGDSRVIVLYEPKNGDVFSEDSLDSYGRGVLSISRWKTSLAQNAKQRRKRRSRRRSVRRRRRKS